GACVRLAGEGGRGAAGEPRADELGLTTWRHVRAPSPGRFRIPPLQAILGPAPEAPLARGATCRSPLIASTAPPPARPSTTAGARPAVASRARPTSRRCTRCTLRRCGGSVCD